jgi:hypothetical protein
MNGKAFTNYWLMKREEFPWHSSRDRQRNFSLSSHHYGVKMNQSSE